MSQPSWIDHARDLLAAVEAQTEALEEASAICARSIAADGLVHVFGTGHSRIPVEELFPRYGSYPGFHPLVELSMTFHTQVVGANGQRQAMFIERMEGLAAEILRNFLLRETDALIVFSHSGVNAVPVEMAMLGREAGLAVIAVTSLAHNAATATTHPSGTRLVDHADVVLDLGTPAGDALVEVEGFPAPVGPGSSLSAVAIANTLKVRTAERLAEKGVSLPVISRSDGLAATGRDLFEEAYAEHARRLAAVLRR